MSDDRYWDKLEEIDGKLNELRILVAGKYVTRKEFGAAVGVVLGILGTGLALVA